MRKTLTAVGQLYQQAYYCFRIGSYSGFIRGFCAVPIADYLWHSPIYQQQIMHRLFEARQMLSAAIHLGIEHPQVQKKFKQLNSSHQSIPLHDEHFLYAVANFVIDPIRVLRLRGKKRLTQQQMQTFLAFWYEFANGMKLKVIPSTLRGWLRIRNQYEEKYKGFSAAQNQLLKVSLGTTLTLVTPPGCRSLLFQAIIWQLPQEFCQHFKLSKSMLAIPLMQLLRWL